MLCDPQGPLNQISFGVEADFVLFGFDRKKCHKHFIYPGLLRCWLPLFASSVTA